MEIKIKNKYRNSKRLRITLIASLVFLAVWFGLIHRRAEHSKRDNYFVELNDIKASNTNIFFIESSCGTENLKKSEKDKRNKNVYLNERQICAIESTARMNPNRQIYLLYSCPLRDDFIKNLPPYTERLFRRPHVHIVLASIADVLVDTPVEILYVGRRLEPSYYPVEHVSDITRLALLWWFGGTYLDLDVITVRSLEGLGTNYAGVQDSTLINNAVINVEPEGFGHHIVETALKHINRHFNGSIWSGNGPDALTKVILRECGIKEVLESGSYCEDFKIYPPYIFYPIHYTEFNLLFDPKRGKTVTSLVKNVSFVVHTWNRMSRGEAVVRGSSQAYDLLASEYCPDVYASSGSVF